MPLSARVRLALLRILVAPVLTAAACATLDSLLPPAGDQIALGTWGGDNAGLIATDSLTHVHIGCTFGDIVGRVMLDADGRFNVSGSYMLRAYPVAVGPMVPAQFSGQVSGSMLTFSVAVNDTVEKKLVALGPATVYFARQPTMGACPICAVPRRRT